MNFGALSELNDPLLLIRTLWPDVKLYGPQRDMVMSVRDAKETYVVAGNMLGKDYVAGLICWLFFLAPQAFFEPEYVRDVQRTRSEPKYYLRHSRRIITTSVKDEHLDVLWAEISRHAQSCAYPLKEYTCTVHHEVRLISEQHEKNPVNYLKGQVSKQGEGLAGHHAAYTLAIGDEASGLVDEAYKQFQGWAKRQLFFGNPNPCENFFKREYAKGDLLA